MIRFEKGNRFEGGREERRPTRPWKGWSGPVSIRRTNLSMRTSKNRRRVASRARYTRAGWATGRSGRVAVLLFCLLCLRLPLFCSVFLFIPPLAPSPLFSPSRNISLARPFHLPRYLSLPPPFARSPPSNVAVVARDRFITLTTFIRRRHTYPPPHTTITPPRKRRPLSFVGAPRSPVPTPSIVARPQKDANFNSILSNIIYVCMR